MARIPADQAALVQRPEGAQRLHGDARRPRSWSSCEQRQQRLGEPGEVPLGDDGLVAVGVAAAVVDRAEHRGRVEGLHEGARSVVDGLAGDRHVVGVHHPVDEADEHPPGHQRRLRRDHRLEQREVRVLGLPPPSGWCRAIAWSASRRSRSTSPVRARRTGSCRPAGGCSRPGRARRRAAGSRAAPADRSRPRPATGWSGMPSACIASLMTYSRSIGPTAARPSPPRANGVRPEPLRCRSRTAPVGVDELAEQQRAPVAEPRDEAAELVAGVGLRHRRGAVRDEVAGQEPHARRGCAASRRRGRARRPACSLSTSSRGSGACSACHRSASSGSSRAKRLPSSTVCAVVTTPGYGPVSAQNGPSPRFVANAACRYRIGKRRQRDLNKHPRTARSRQIARGT